MIKVNLDEILREKKMTSKELAEIINITEANLSVLRSGKAKAIRFSTLSKLCEVLEVEPGDILSYEFGDDEND